MRKIITILCFLFLLCVGNNAQAAFSIKKHARTAAVATTAQSDVQATPSATSGGEQMSALSKIVELSKLIPSTHHHKRHHRNDDSRNGVISLSFIALFVLTIVGISVAAPSLSVGAVLGLYAFLFATGIPATIFGFRGVRNDKHRGYGLFGAIAGIALVSVGLVIGLVTLIALSLGL